MKENMLTIEGVVELTAEETANVCGGGNGFINHLRCMREAFMSSPVKSIVLGGTIWGMARNAGIAVGCTGG